MITQFKSSKAIKQSRIIVSAIFTKFVNDKLQQFAKYLSKKTQSVQPRSVAAFLLTLCLIGALALCIQLFYAFRQGSAIKIQSIDSQAVKPSYSFSADTTILHRIKSFHRHLDSLKQHDFLHYDSIMKCRPHLLDSIITVEQLTNF